MCAKSRERSVLEDDSISKEDLQSDLNASFEVKCNSEIVSTKNEFD